MFDALFCEHAGFMLNVGVRGECGVKDL